MRPPLPAGERIRVRGVLLFAGLAAAALVAALAALVSAEPYLAVDDAIARAIQGVDWGPLVLAFPVFRWAGGPGGLYVQGGAIVLVLLFNRRAWLLAVAATAGGVWYWVLVNLVNRPRPTTAQVLRVTEHPGAGSFPSGHVLFITLTLGILMLCIGNRYLPAGWRAIGWAVVAVIVAWVGLSRIYVGAHWPTDVVAGALIAAGWLCLVSSARWSYPASG